MNARTRILATTAALALGLGLAGAGTAHADKKPTAPGESKACDYAGGSYSHGSFRQQKYQKVDGTTVYANYYCVNGEWVFHNYSRTKESAANEASKRPGYIPPRS